MRNNTLRLGYVFLLGFAVVVGGLFYWQVIRSGELLERGDNPRIVVAELKIRRGAITDRHGGQIAFSEVMPDGLVTRHYPAGAAAAHVGGYYSIRYGVSGAEAAFDGLLRGEYTPLDDLLHLPRVGEDVRLTLDLPAQKEADRLLGERKGAIVVLRPGSGEVLVMVSHPSYDPNLLDERWDALSSDEDAPLLNRATQGIYPLGEASVLLEMAAPPEEAVRAFRLDEGVDFELDTSAGVIPLPEKLPENLPDLGITPLHAALIAASIARGDGAMPHPHITYGADVAPARPAIDAQTARALAESLPENDPPGIAGVATGQETGGEPVGWFIGFSGAGGDDVAIAVVVEGSPGRAAEIAAALPGVIGNR